MSTKALEPVIDCAGAPLHKNKQSKRAAKLLNRLKTIDIFDQQVNEIAKIKRRVSDKFRNSLQHKLNNRHTDLPDKIDGNTAAVRHNCIAVSYLTAKVVGIQEDSSVPTALNATRVE